MIEPRKCYFCGKRTPHYILEDIGGQIATDNRVEVCDTCASRDVIRRYYDGELNIDQFVREMERIGRIK